MEKCQVWTIGCFSEKRVLAPPLLCTARPERNSSVHSRNCMYLLILFLEYMQLYIFVKFVQGVRRNQDLT